MGTANIHRLGTIHSLIFLVRTTENDGTNTDDNILVKEDFTIRDTATLRLSDDAADTDNTDDTF